MQILSMDYKWNANVLSMKQKCSEYGVCIDMEIMFKTPSLSSARNKYMEYRYV